MATLLCQTVVGFASCSSMASGFRGPALPNSRVRAAASQKRVGVVGVRAEIETQVVLNPSIAKDSEKVVDTVMLAEVSKPVTAFCRCWRSGTFPLCDGTHVKHNKATGDNVGPLVLKK